uniref:Uncharacterized protein n=1 Tax=Ciona intestinalis TaxID=7719 RepID=H2XRH4_CIOIN
MSGEMNQCNTEATKARTPIYNISRFPMKNFMLKMGIAVYFPSRPFNTFVRDEVLNYMLYREITRTDWKKALTSLANKRRKQLPCLEDSGVTLLQHLYN